MEGLVFSPTENLPLGIECATENSFVDFQLASLALPGMHKMQKIDFLQPKPAISALR